MYPGRASMYTYDQVQMLRTFQTCGSDLATQHQLPSCHHQFYLALPRAKCSHLPVWWPGSRGCVVPSVRPTFCSLFLFSLSFVPPVIRSFRRPLLQRLKLSIVSLINPVDHRTIQSLRRRMQRDAPAGGTVGAICNAASSPPLKSAQRPNVKPSEFPVVKPNGCRRRKHEERTQAAEHLRKRAAITQACLPTRFTILTTSACLLARSTTPVSSRAPST